MEKILSSPLFMAEIAIVIAIIVMQLIIFFRNNISIHNFKKLYPFIGTLETETVELALADEDETASAIVIKGSGNHSKTFQNILQSSNVYLKRNAGEADPEILKNIAEERDSSVETAIEASIPMPLYIGLFCTFLGVILGLVSIISGSEITDSGVIDKFLAGVLIAMIGSAMGLLLTTRSNYLFKGAREQRDKGRFDYLAFLRAHVQKPLLAQQKESSGLTELRQTLGAFHDGFSQYQTQLNSSLGESVGLFSKLKDVLSRIKTVENGLASIGENLEHNDNIIEKQVAYIDSYTQKAASFASILGEHFQRVDEKLNHLVDEGMNKLESGTQAAYIKMDNYLASLENAEAGRELVDGIRSEMTSIKTDVAMLQKQSLELNQKMLGQMQKDDQLNQQMSKQMEAMAANLKQVYLAEQSRTDFTDSFAFKAFTVTGIAAFLLALGLGIGYFIQNFA